MDSLLVQFAKWPETGKVKTRLGKTLGDEAAKDVHITLMTHVLSRTQGQGSWHNLVSFSALPQSFPDELSSFESLLRANHVQLSEQVSGDLGDKLQGAFSHHLQKYEKVVVVGSDCPTIDAAYVSEAFAALNKHDLVLGPAEDGGYVLIGLKRAAADLFNEVPWGSAAVRRTTIENASHLGMSVGLLAMAWDVDEQADYERYLDTYAS